MADVAELGSDQLLGARAGALGAITAAEDENCRRFPWDHG
jgi:hypothetical protein